MNDTILMIEDMARTKDGDVMASMHEIDTDNKLHRWFDVYLWGEDIPEDADEDDLAVMAKEKAQTADRNDLDWQTEKQLRQERDEE